MQQTQGKAYLSEQLKDPMFLKEAVRHIHLETVLQDDTEFVILDALSHVFEELYQVSFIVFVEEADDAEYQQIVGACFAQENQLFMLTKVNSIEQLNKECFKKWSKGFRVSIISHQNNAVEISEKIKNPHLDTLVKCSIFLYCSPNDDLSDLDPLLAKEAAIKNIQFQQAVYFHALDELKEELEEEVIRKHRGRRIPNFVPITSANKSIGNNFRYNIFFMLNKLNREEACEDFLKLAKKSAEHLDQGANSTYQELEKILRASCEKGTCRDIVSIYSVQSFFHKLINNGLRILRSPSQIAYLRYPFNLLFRQIFTLFMKQVEHLALNKELVCYRGCYLTESQIQFMKQNIGGFIQTEGFISTSLSKVVSDNFGKDRLIIRIPPLDKSDSIKGLCGFADISEFSTLKDERQILFNPLNIFKVLSLTLNEEGKRCIVELEYSLISRIEKKPPEQLLKTESELLRNYQAQQKARESIENQGDCFEELFLYRDSVKYYSKNMQQLSLSRMEQYLGYSQIDINLSNEEEKELEGLLLYMADVEELGDCRDYDFLLLMVKKMILVDIKSYFSKLGILIYRVAQDNQKALNLLLLESFIIKHHKKLNPANLEKADYNLSVVYNYLGIIYGEQNNVQYTNRYFKESLRLIEKISGQNSPQYRIVLKNYKQILQKWQLEKPFSPLEDDCEDMYYLKAKKLEKEGKYGEAIKCLLELEKIYEHTIGEENVSFITNVDNLGRLYKKDEQLSLALKTLERCRDLQIKYRGISHPLYGKALFNIGQIYQIMGDLNKAERLYLQCRKTQLNYGFPNRDSKMEYNLTLNGLIYVCLQKRQLSKVRQFAEEAERFAEQNNLTEQISHIKTLRYKAQMLQFEKQFQEALAVLTSAKQVIERVHGVENVHRAEVQAQFGIIQAQRGKLNKSKQLLKRALAMFDCLQMKFTHQYSKILHFLGRLHEAEAEYQEALSSYKQAHNIMVITHNNNKAELHQLANAIKRLSNSKNLSKDPSTAFEQRFLMTHNPETGERTIRPVTNEERELTNSEGQNEQNQKRNKESDEKMNESSSFQGQIDELFALDLSIGNYEKTKSFIMSIFEALGPLDGVKQAVFYRNAITRMIDIGLIESNLKLCFEQMLVLETLNGGKQKKSTRSDILWMSLIEKLIPFIVCLDKEAHHQRIGALLNGPFLDCEQKLNHHFEIYVIGTVFNLISGQEFSTNYLSVLRWISHKQSPQACRNISRFSRVGQIMVIQLMLWLESTQQELSQQKTKQRQKLDVQLLQIIHNKCEAADTVFLWVLATLLSKRGSPITSKILKVVLPRLKPQVETHAIRYFLFLSKLLPIICEQQSEAGTKDKEEKKEQIRMCEECAGEVVVKILQEGESEAKVAYFSDILAKMMSTIS